MNFMLSNMKTIILSIFILLISTKLFAQEANTRSLDISVGVGYSLCLYTLNTTYADQMNKNGVMADCRILLQSENSLGIGFESGFFNLSHLKSDAYNADQNGIPLLLLFSHKIGDFRAVAGVGYYYLITKISDGKLISESSDFNFGYSFEVDYSMKLNKRLRLVPEIKYYNITDFSKSLLIIACKCEYRLEL